MTKRERWKLKNRATVNLQHRRAYKRNPERKKFNAWACDLRKFGLTPSTYADLLTSQLGKCAICAVPATETRCRLHVDHDHRTGEVRGLLCGECNLGLGKFRDNPGVLRRAAGYLDGVVRDADDADGLPCHDAVAGVPPAPPRP